MEVTYSNEQFYFITLLITWLIMISLSLEDKKYGIMQLFIGIPLSLWIFGISFFNSLLYGYLIGGAFIFTTLTILLTTLWSKDKNG